VELLTRVSELRDRTRAARARGLTVGLVPTMGALHEGHRSLVRRARAECGLVVVTLFVNPAQFAPSEDLSRYPRDLEGDRAAVEAEGADLLFAPPVEAVYPPGFATTVAVEGLTASLEGASRPTHFAGVTTVVAKLFNMAQPDRAYFGQKDYQQLQVVRRMARDLDFPVEILACPTVREPDGLAMSSRNRYLSPQERQSALALSRALRAAGTRFDSGERHAPALLRETRALLEEDFRVRIDYVELVDAETLSPVDVIGQPAVLLIAAFVGSTRLIDNVLLVPER